MDLDWDSICRSRPRHWRLLRFGEVFLERKERGGTDLPLLSVTKSGIHPQEDTDRRDTSNSDKSRYKVLEKGDIAYNTMRMWQGRSALADIEGLVSPAYTVIRPKDGIDPAFASSLLRFQPLVRKFRATSQGLVSDTWNLKYAAFAKIKTVLPPDNEQTKIAEILASVDEAIQSTRTVIEQTRRVKEGLLQDLLTKGIGHRRFTETEIGRTPESWKLTSLGAVLNTIQAGKSPSAADDPAGKDEWGVLKVSAVGNGQFFPERNKTLPRDYAVNATHRVQSGDVLITRANTADLVGAVCEVPDGPYRLMLSDKTLRLEPDQEKITPGFLAEVAARPLSRQYFARRATGSSASMKNLSQGKIKSLPIPLPPLAEQREIEKRLSGMREAIRAQIEIEGALQRTKAGLLQDLLTGKVRVKV